MPSRQPDASTRVRVDGHEVVTYSYGSGSEVLFLLNGLVSRKDRAARWYGRC